jgi:hypothetical protein
MPDYFIPAGILVTRDTQAAPVLRLTLFASLS